MAPGPNTQPTAARVLRRIRGRGPGSVFVPRDFLDLGRRGAVDVALHRLVREGVIRRIGRGLYDLPELHDRFGPLASSMHDVAAAIARSTGETVVRSGAAAANALGLSTQVPARSVYLTDGTSRTVRVGNQAIQFKHAAPSKLVGGDTTAGLIVRAIRHLGPQDVDDVALRRLGGLVDDAVARDLRRLRRDTPSWMQPLIQKLVDQGRSRAA